METAIRVVYIVIGLCHRMFSREKHRRFHDDDISSVCISLDFLRSLFSYLNALGIPLAMHRAGHRLDTEERSKTVMMIVEEGRVSSSSLLQLFPSHQESQYIIHC